MAAGGAAPSTTSYSCAVIIELLLDEDEVVELVELLVDVVVLVLVEDVLLVDDDVLVDEVLLVEVVVLVDVVVGGTSGQSPSVSDRLST